MDGALTVRGSKRVAVRGAAMVEAVVMVPVLLLLLFGVLHVARGATAQLRAGRQARHCALSYAFRGCAEVPDGCADVLSDARAAPDDAITDQVGSEALRELGEVVGEMGSIATFPIVGDALRSLFGHQATATTRKSYQGHLPGGGGERVQVGRFTVICNVKPRAGDGVAKELFDAIPL